MTYDPVIIFGAMVLGICIGFSIFTFIEVSRLERDTDYARGYSNGISDGMDLKRVMEKNGIGGRL